ncbi:MAG: ABC transporter permease [Lachnospiraceae bacterium]|nr:ABC transporter permease [Lachnospiraceae bacterium]
MGLLISVLEQGMIYAIMALGIYITYKILDFPDLTVDGSFPMGAAITAIMITNGCPAILSLPAAFAVGALTGILTGLIHVKLKVTDLLSGIIMMTALYTVNLRIAGRANLPFYKEETVFENALTNSVFTGSLGSFKTVIVMLVILLVVKLLLDAYLQTGSGFLLRAVGDNASIVTAMGEDRGKMKILGLAIANGLVSLSGCLLAQQQRFFEISMGTGTMVIGLASVIIGTSLYQKLDSMGKMPAILHKVRVGIITASVILGSIVYKACVAIAIRLGLKTQDLKLVTAVLFLMILVLSMEKKRTKKDA